MKHVFLENMKKCKKYGGKCYNQQQYKAILEAAMEFNFERLD